MPAYYFHLAFELGISSTTSVDVGDDHDQAFKPPPNLDVFCASLPVHKSSSWVSYVAPRRVHQTPRSNVPSESSHHQQSKPRTHSPSPSKRDVNAHVSLALPTVTDPSKPSDQAQNQPTDAIEDTPSDYRIDKISLESVDMESPAAAAGEHPAHDSSPSLDSGPLGLKGKYIPSDPKTTDFGWGVVHLYRDRLPSHELDDDSANPQTSSASDNLHPENSQAYVDEDSTTLCILAVPAYMTPSDLLGWLGESTRELVSHFRLVRTARSNRYMVLMKFREGKEAKRWQKEWNGKLFNSMEPENCHIVFVKSIQFQNPETRSDPTNFPDMTNDPFTPDTNRQIIATSHDTTLTAEASQKSASLTTKPVPPPTPALIELPTCPVCLERMDDTNGLATIFCQHVFHCACLQKWQGNGCPVCRYTQNDHLHTGGHQPVDDQCRVCGSVENLWMCLICGHVGCGRYDEAHAFAHFEQTSHSFAMDLTTQVIWDYIGDEYVHRLIQNKADGKLVELPSSTAKGPGTYPAVPEEKLENMGLEYSNLLKGQLDSQRLYFEEQVDRAVDKATEASASADRATAATLKATEQLEAIQSSYDVLLKETLPGLERSKERAEARASKFESMARKMEKEWKEKDVISESLMDRIAYLEKQVNEMTLKNSDLEEQNRDLSFFISGMEKLKDQGTDVQEGTLQVADPPEPGKKKKGKTKK